MELLYSCLILAGGAACAWFYLRRPPVGSTSRDSVPPPATPGLELSHDRPWRRLGAAICLLLSIMFVLGIYVLDEKRSLRLYVAYWAVILVLIAWLCGLAIRDILYTRRLVSRWRRDHRGPARRQPWFEVRDEDLRT